MMGVSPLDRHPPQGASSDRIVLLRSRQSSLLTLALRSQRIECRTLFGKRLGRRRAELAAGDQRNLSLESSAHRHLAVHLHR